MDAVKRLEYAENHVQGPLYMPADCRHLGAVLSGGGRGGGARLLLGGACGRVRRPPVAAAAGCTGTPAAAAGARRSGGWGPQSPAQCSSSRQCWSSAAAGRPPADRLAVQTVHGRASRCSTRAAPTPTEWPHRVRPWRRKPGVWRHSKVRVLPWAGNFLSRPLHHEHTCRWFWVWLIYYA
jgi:hypothetical protein